MGLHPPFLVKDNSLPSLIRVHQVICHIYQVEGDILKLHNPKDNLIKGILQDINNKIISRIITKMDINSKTTNKVLIHKIINKLCMVIHPKKEIDLLEILDGVEIYIILNNLNNLIDLLEEDKKRWKMCFDE